MHTEICRCSHPTSQWLAFSATVYPTNVALLWSASELSSAMPQLQPCTSITSTDAHRRLYDSRAQCVDRVNSPSPSHATFRGLPSPSPWHIRRDTIANWIIEPYRRAPPTLPVATLPCSWNCFWPSCHWRSDKAYDSCWSGKWDTRSTLDSRRGLSAPASLWVSCGAAMQSVYCCAHHSGRLTVRDRVTGCWPTSDLAQLCQRLERETRAASAGLHDARRAGVGWPTGALQTSPRPADIERSTQKCRSTWRWAGTRVDRGNTVLPRRRHRTLAGLRRSW